MFFILTGYKVTTSCRRAPKHLPHLQMDRTRLRKTTSSNECLNIVLTLLFLFVTLCRLLLFLLIFLL